MTFSALKIVIKLSMRCFKDMLTFDFFRFSRKRDNGIALEYVLSMRQEIKANETFESKRTNFKIASKKINKVIIYPNEIFSFWHIIGNPKKQFEKGRTIQNGKIKEDIGGGLCQVSGLVYYISLLAGLKIIERHNHSVDLYNDETRFCPLGTDATIVYGYKDLRILNSNSFPIKFEILVIENFIEIKLYSKEKIEEHQLNFKIEENIESTTVCITNEYNDFVNTSNYKKIH